MPHFAKQEIRWSYAVVVLIASFLWGCANGRVKIQVLDDKKLQPVPNAEVSAGDRRYGFMSLFLPPEPHSALTDPQGFVTISGISVERAPIFISVYKYGYKPINSPIDELKPSSDSNDDILNGKKVLKVRIFHIDP